MEINEVGYLCIPDSNWSFSTLSESENVKLLASSQQKHKFSGKCDNSDSFSLIPSRCFLKIEVMVPSQLHVLSPETHYFPDF